VIAINVKYLGKYIKWESGQVKAMHFYLRYINHLGSLQKKSAHRRLQAGFTITEVLLAGVMMLIAVLVSGIGVINLLRSNYRANADSEIRNNLNRTLEFVSDDVRRAKIIAENEAAIGTDRVTNWDKIKESKQSPQAVLAFQIPDPGNPGQALPNQIVYYTRDPENSLTGPRVLWRYGPDLDENGNYRTPEAVATWQHSPVTDMLAAVANDPNCPGGFTRIPARDGDVDGFYTCVRGGQVILNANAQVNLTTGYTKKDQVDYAVSTRVFTRAPLFVLIPLGDPPPPPPPIMSPGAGFDMRLGGGEDRPTPTLPTVTQPATVIAEILEGKTCESNLPCGVIAAPDKDLPGKPTVAMGLPVQANNGDGIVVFVNGLRNVYENPQVQTVDVYTTSDRDRLPAGIKLDNNQVLFVLKNLTNSQSYQVLVTFTPR